jgi:hypothetical protein
MLNGVSPLVLKSIVSNRLRNTVIRIWTVSDILDLRCANGIHFALGYVTVLYNNQPQ